MFPGVFEGEEEIAWSAALLLLKDVSETQHVPLPLLDGRLALKGLADHLFSRFRERNSDLDAVITLGRAVLEFTPLQHPQRHSALINIAKLLSERFKQKGSEKDLDEIIALRRIALESMAPNHPQRPIILLNLDGCLYDRFRMRDAQADLEDIISLRRAALENIHPHPIDADLFSILPMPFTNYFKNRACRTT